MVVSPKTETVKFLCSYGGKILPRYPDGKLRYHGGHTRVLAVHRSVSFSELTARMAEMCGSPVVLRCQLPNEDLDALISVTSDEDLVNLVEEYDRVSTAAPATANLSPLKIRAFLYPPRCATKKSTVSPPSAPASTSEPSSSSSSFSSSSTSPRSSAKPPLPPSPPRVAARNPYYGCYVHRKPSLIYLIHNGNHWQ